MTVEELNRIRVTNRGRKYDVILPVGSTMPTKCLIFATANVTVLFLFQYPKFYDKTYLVF